MIRHLRYLALILPLAAWSCASGSNETALKAIYDLQAANVGLDAAILAYDKLPFCAPVPVPPCADKHAVIALGKAEDSAQQVLDGAESVIRANPSVDAKALIQAATTAVGAVSAILDTYSVKH